MLFEKTIGRYPASNASFPYIYKDNIVEIQHFLAASGQNVGITFSLYCINTLAFLKA